MTFTHRLLSLVALAFVASLGASTANAQYANDNTTGISVRPFTVAQAMAGYSLSSYKIHNVGVNVKGINVTGTAMPDGSYIAYRFINITKVDISGIHRTPGGHVDFIRLASAGNKQKWPTTVKIQDAYLHDGDGIPLLVQDLWIDQLTLRNVRVERVTVGIQIGAAAAGKIDKVFIDGCPNQSIAILGRPGSIKTVYIKRSPGLKISDVLNQWGQARCKFVHLD